MFCTVSVMENVPPGVTVVGGLLTTVSTRSGPLTVTCVAEALQLLLSFVSGTTRVSSARSEERRVGHDVPALTVTVTVQLEVALEASEVTARLPVSRRAPLFEVVVER